MSFWTERFEECEHDETDHEIWQREDDHERLCEVFEEEME